MLLAIFQRRNKRIRFKGAPSSVMYDRAYLQPLPAFYLLIKSKHGMACCPIILAIFCGSLFTHGQVPAQRHNQSNRLYGVIKTVSFLHNSEYFSPLIEGQTLGGFQVHPWIGYYATPYFVTQGGVFCRRYWGEKKFFSALAPTFCVLFFIRPSLHLTMGSLPTGNMHRLIAPFYNPTDVLTMSPPTGLDFSWKGETGFFHTWIDWRTLLDKQGQQPEELVAGLSTERRLGAGLPLQLHVPLQVLVYHQGGQGIVIKDFSLWMGTLGVCLSWQRTEHIIKNITWGSYYVMNTYIKSVNRSFRNGTGWLFQLGGYTNFVSLQLAYWQANGFSSENVGTPLYQSMRLVEGKIVHQERSRKLMLLDIDCYFLFRRDLSFSLHIAPYYDIRHRLLEHAMGLCIHYTPLFYKESSYNQSY
jgi:hypothetical protein